MKNTLLHVTKREMHRLSHSKSAWIILAGVSLALALSGPFGTIGFLSLLERLVYWPVIVVVTFYTGWIVEAFLDSRDRMQALPVVPRVAVSGLAIGVAVWLELLLINTVFFGPEVLSDGSDLAILALNVIAISTVIAGILTAVGPWGGRHAAPVTGQARVPRILDRLPFDKRGALMSLTVQDHYVQVVTDKGQALILMRLSDAIAETEGCPGLQVHRSHWVAMAQIAGVRRDGARAVITLQDGRDIPVSRSHVPNLKQAGVL